MMLRYTMILTAMVAAASPAARAEDHDCLIEPWQTLKLAAAVPGVVASVDVDRGDAVRAGQVVAKLDSDVEEANARIASVHAANETAIASNGARVDYLRRKRGRNDQLRTGNIVSLESADEAAADVKVAEAQLHEAELNVAQARLEARRAEGLLQQRRVVSPVNGVVTERALGPGEFRNDQSHILTVAQMDPLRVEAFLPVGMYGQVKVGMTAIVRPEQPVGGSYPAKVVVVDKVLDAASGTMGVRLQLPNPNLRLPAGIHCQLDFSVDGG